MNQRLTILALVLLLVGCATAPTDSTPPAKAKGARYEADETPLPVGAIPNAVLHDAVRNKDLDVVIEYPTRGGPYPVIVFSHGFGGSKNGYIALTEYWTGHGFVCIKPTHADAGQLRNLRELETVWESQGEREWSNRVRDISLVIDSLARLEELYPELKGRMDHTRIGVGGHSYGAFTTMLIAGVTPFRDGAPIRLHDDRVKAALAMSPQGAGTAGLTRQSWGDARIPTLYMTGSLDRGVKGEEPSWRRDPFQYSAAGDKYFVNIEGARHMSFTGRFADIAEELSRAREEERDRAQPVNPFNPTQQQREQDRRGQVRDASLEKERRIFTAIKIASTAFWEAYLKGETAAREFLQSKSGVESLNGGAIQVERK